MGNNNEMVEVYLRRMIRRLVCVATLGLCLVSFASLPDGMRIEVAAALEDGFYALRSSRFGQTCSINLVIWI